ncbi:Putative uncharacterized protein [Bifidobacterium animalis subsp. animalis IM386]|uniref:Uncharacterized protein n=1 Tax=Bifidobacterium animalis subsp. animalis IM386 TaxID=1402194 RepID=A0AAV2W2C8_9BIFI|nr:Putative uncharacterized protein [Bifidobacterium animalis subsp. animalis IM386]
MQLGGDDRGFDVDVRQELLGDAAHTTADHEQLGAEVQLHETVVLGEALGPLLIAHVELFTDRRCRILLRIALALRQLDVAELGVGDEHAIVDQSGADTGAEGGGDDKPLLACRRTERLFRQTGRVRVVDHGDRATACLREHLGHVHTNPRLIEVRHEVELLARLDRSRERNAHRHVLGHFEMLELLAHDISHGLGSGVLGGEDLQAGFGEFALLQIHRGGLDARATDVNAECLCSVNHCNLPCRSNPRRALVACPIPHIVAYLSDMKTLDSLIFLIRYTIGRHRKAIVCRSGDSLLIHRINK